MNNEDFLKFLKAAETQEKENFEKLKDHFTFLKKEEELFKELTQQKQ